MYKLIKACLVSSVLSLSAFGIALIVISYLPFNPLLPLSEVKGFFDSFSHHGGIVYLSIENVIYLRFMGILICVVLGLAYSVRKLVLQYVSDIEITYLLLNPKKVVNLIFNFIRDLKEVVIKVEPSDFLIHPKNIVRLIANFTRDLIVAVKKEDKIHSYSFILLILLATAVRIYYLFGPFIADETAVFEARINHAYGLTGLLQLISKYEIIGDHMFQTLLSYLTSGFLGSEQYIWVVRLPVLFAGILLVPATYMVVRIFYNKYAALLASGIIAASSPYIYYSTKARGYSILWLVFILILSLGAYLKKNNNLAGWHLFAILSAFGFYTIPLMLWPYGIVITWLILSIFFKDTHVARSYILKNLLVSIVLTVFLTFLLYSPVIFLGTGLKSFFVHQRVESIPWLVFTGGFYNNIGASWRMWSKNIPDAITYFFLFGFFISLFIHNKLSAQRINLALAACIWLIPVLIFQKVVPEPRHLLFLLPLYIGIASSGLTYLFEFVETIFRNYKSAGFAILAIILSIFLMRDIVQSEQYLEIDHFDESGEYIDFAHIKNCLLYHIMSDLSGMNIPLEIYGTNVPLILYGKDPGNNMKSKDDSKILIMFKSASENNFWTTGLQKLRHIKSYISDINSYISKDSRRCHSLFLISDENAHDLGVLLEEHGVSASDYSGPQLIHRFKKANLYKMQRIKECSNSAAREYTEAGPVE